MNSSFKRVLLLFRKQWMEDRRLFMLGILAISLLQLFLLLLEVYTADQGLHSSATSMIAVLGLFLTGSIFSSNLLNRFRHKSEAIFSFMTPASAGEKLVVALVYSMILFPVLYMLLFSGNLYIARYVERFVRLERYNLVSMGRADITMVVLFYWVSQAVVLLFSLVFRRYAFLISACFLAAVCIAGASLSERMLKNMVAGKKPALSKEVLLYGTEVVHARLDNSNPLSNATFLLDVKVGNDPYMPRRVVYLNASLSRSSEILFTGFVVMGFIFLLYIVWCRLKEQQL
jgi:hypothetical protein